jgi:chemotaxis family two-component system sensor kinase Cph1
MTLEPVDLAALVEDMVDEARLAYPTIVYDLHTPVRRWCWPTAAAWPGAVEPAEQCAPPRRAESAIRSGWRLHAGAGLGRARSRERGRADPAETEATLFNPFKRSSLNNPRNRTGMGLGLYIAQQIVREHEGEIGYRHEEGPEMSGRVIFAVRLPLAGPPNAS